MSMATITDERFLELLELYEKLKVRIIQIDEKYSLDYIEPKLDMPDSLNLTKLEYTPKTEEELMDLAAQQVEAAVLAKEASIYKAYTAKINSLSVQSAKVNMGAEKKLSAAQADQDTEVENIRKRLINNGLLFSTLYAKYESLAKQNYESKVNDINADKNNELELLSTQVTQAETAYQESLASLEQEKAARIAAAYQKLLEAEEALKRSIDKYNSGLDEKEAKYQASRARAYESARNAAYNRAYNNSKLYMQMGETGYRRMVEKEKYTVAQNAFYPLRRNEANTILGLDAFLVTHLGTYYKAFEDWVNTTLLP